MLRTNNTQNQGGEPPTDKVASLDVYERLPTHISTIVKLEMWFLNRRNWTLSVQEGINEQLCLLLLGLNLLLKKSKQVWLCRFGL